jgi:hypothetical protein
MLRAMQPLAGSYWNRGLGITTLGAMLVFAPMPVSGQGAVDPNVAPRAAELNRQGERGLGIEMLGRYLAVAQSDGRAWFLLAKFYRMDARDWHRAGHHGDPSADVFLSLASVAVDESIRLHVDSAALYRALVTLDRTLLSLEDSGWAAAQGAAAAMPPLPPIVAELGRNFAASCPANGVVITGSEVEWLAAWHGAMAEAGRRDLIPLRVDLYATDPLYRARMASVLGVDATASLADALRSVAARRPLCLAPAMGLGGMPDVSWTPLRLMRVSDSTARAPEVPLSLTSLVVDVANGGSTWTSDVLAIYGAAARQNQLLCQSLAPVAGSLPVGACEQ